MEPTVPSIDIVNRVDMFEVENALNNTRKQIATRYDFRGSKASLTLDTKEKKIQIVVEDKMKMEAIREMFLQQASKRKLAIKLFQFEEPQPGAEANLKREVKIRHGIEQDLAKQMVKMIKDSKLKVQASIQGDELRVSGKQIDDLQAVMTLLRGANLETPLQFVNMKS